MLDSARIHGDPTRFSVFFFLFQYSAGFEKKEGGGGINSCICILTLVCRRSRNDLDSLDFRYGANGGLGGAGPLRAPLISTSGHNCNYATGRDEAANLRRCWRCSLLLRLFLRRRPKLGSRLQGWSTPPPLADSRDGNAQKAALTKATPRY